MALPRGITGFWRVGEQQPPTSDVCAFRAHCYEAAGRVSYQVVSVESAGLRNFAFATLHSPGERIAILLNAHFPGLAFAETPIVGEGLPRFLDHPILADSFREVGAYVVFSASELERRPVPEDLAELSVAERTQVAYWRPRRIGDVIFNHWD